MQYDFGTDVSGQDFQGASRNDTEATSTATTTATTTATATTATAIATATACNGTEASQAERKRLNGPALVHPAQDRDATGP